MGLLTFKLEPLVGLKMEGGVLVGEALGERFKAFVLGERGAADLGEDERGETARGEPAACGERGERIGDTFFGEPQKMSFSGLMLISSSDTKTAGAARGDLAGIEASSGPSSRGLARGDALGEVIVREAGFRDVGDSGISSCFTCSRARWMKPSVSGSDIHSMRRLLSWRTTGEASIMRSSSYRDVRVQRVNSAQGWGMHEYEYFALWICSQ
jgi:hypothetical protein